MTKHYRPDEMRHCVTIPLKHSSGDGKETGSHGLLMNECGFLMGSNLKTLTHTHRPGGFAVPMSNTRLVTSTSSRHAIS